MNHVTATVIFEGSALNRDEKIGGNILSIKKLQVNDMVHSFISKYALRHYLSQTLFVSSDDYTLSEIFTEGKKEKDLSKDVIQFDVLKSDILSSFELDAFGYMFTIGGERSIARRAPVTMTKAISLFPYGNDMAFYSNHGLAERANKAGIIDAFPNPFSKEEHYSLYKMTFTIDAYRFGEDDWVVAKEPEVDGDTLTIRIGKGFEKHIQGELVSHNKFKAENGYVEWVCLGDAYRVYFVVDEEVKKRRIEALLRSILGGLYAVSSGESNTIVPLFAAFTIVKTPSPVLHGHLDVEKEDNHYRVTGLESGLNNVWVKKCGDKKLAYIYDSERVRAGYDIKRSTIDSFEEFLSFVFKSER